MIVDSEARKSQQTFVKGKAFQLGALNVLLW